MESFDETDKGRKREREAEDEATTAAKRAAVDGAQADSSADNILEVPNEMVGRIIGKGGATIRIIQNLSGAHIDVPQECEPGTNMRRIKITGAPSQVAYCITIIRQKTNPNDEGTSIPLPAEGDPANPLKVVVMPVSNEVVGRVIGKGGTTIRQIQDLSGVHLEVAREPAAGSSMREITITGNEAQIEHCQRLVRAKMEGQDLPARGTPAAFGLAPGVPGEMKVCIPDDMVGRVIGKGGSTIREIQDHSGAHMDIEKDCKSGTSQREVTIKGTPLQMSICNGMLQAKIAGQDSVYSGFMSHHNTPSGNGQQYSQQYSHSQQYSPAGYGHSSYSQSQPPQQQQPAAPSYYQSYAATGQSSGYGQQQQQQQSLYGAPAQSSPAADPYAAYYGYGAPQATPAVTSYGGYGGGGGGSSSYGGGSSAFGGGGGKLTSVLTVPNDLIGRVIGKGGQSIKQIQEQSGAHVDIPKDTGVPNREITISGDATQISVCTNLINQKMAARF